MAVKDERLLCRIRELHRANYARPGTPCSTPTSPYVRHVNFHGHYSFAPADLGGVRRALRNPDAPDDD